MIEIEMNTARLKLTVKGHAMPDESPQYKEICAACSALVQALAYTITKFNNEGDALEIFKFQDEPGDVILKVKPTEWAERSIRKRFDVYGDGLELLAMSHPCSVKMIWDGELIIPSEEEQKNE